MGERWPAQDGVNCGNCCNGAHCIDDAACDIFEREDKMAEQAMDNGKKEAEWLPEFGGTVWVLPAGVTDLEKIQFGVVIGFGAFGAKDENGGFVREGTVQIAISTDGRADCTEVPMCEAFRTRLDLLAHYSWQFRTRAAEANVLSSRWDKERFAEMKAARGAPDEGSGPAEDVESGTKITVIESKDGKFTAQWGGPGSKMTCGCLMIDSDGPNTPLRVSCCHPDVIAVQGAVKVPLTEEERAEERRAEQAYQEAVRKDWRNMTTADLMLTYWDALNGVSTALGLGFKDHVSPQERRDLIVEAIRAIRENKPVVEVVSSSPQE